MKLLNGTVASAHLDVVNSVDFLATVQRKERAANYHQTDYLRCKRKIVHSNRISYDDKLVLSASSYFQQDLQQLGRWEISIEGRIQVGQWFFKSTFLLRRDCMQTLLCHLLTYCSHQFQSF